jgi:hypothetical protein
LAFKALKDEVLLFYRDLRVFFTSNVAERGLRMVKIHQRISGYFRNLAAAQAFCATWSYLSTARKHGANPLGVLVSLFRGGSGRSPTQPPGRTGRHTGPAVSHRRRRPPPRPARPGSASQATSPPAPTTRDIDGFIDAVAGGECDRHLEALPYAVSERLRLL